MHFEVSLPSDLRVADVPLSEGVAGPAAKIASTALMQQQFVDMCQVPPPAPPTALVQQQLHNLPLLLFRGHVDWTL